MGRKGEPLPYVEYQALAIANLTHDLGCIARKIAKEQRMANPSENAKIHAIKIKIAELKMGVDYRTKPGEQ